MQFLFALGAVMALLASAQATPTWGEDKRTNDKPKCHKVGGVTIAKFDNITVNSIPIVGSLLTRPPTPYKGLIYQGFAVENNDLQFVGVKPHSGDNDLFYSILTRVTEFTAARIMTKPKQFIDLMELFYSCSVDGDVARVPVDCNILMSSVSFEGRSISTTLGYNKNTNAMQKIDFGDNFNRIKKISFATVLDVSANGLTTQFDSIKYQRYQCD